MLLSWQAMMTTKVWERKQSIDKSFNENYLKWPLAMRNVTKMFFEIDRHMKYKLLNKI